MTALLSPTKSVFRPRHAGQRRLAGFTLPEVIVGVALLSLFMFMCIGLVRAGKRLMPGNALAVDGEVLSIAPSPSAFADSVRLHSVLIDRLNSARAIYVFGGSHLGLPNGASRLDVSPLVAATLPKITTFAAGLPLDGFAFQQAYAGQLGPLAAGGSAADFSVVVIGPWNNQLAVTALVQVREQSINFEDPSLTRKWVRRETRLYDISGDIWNCSFLEKDALGTSAAVGARHFWFRYEEGRVAEEGPVMAVFPDPWLYAGTRADSSEGQPPLSRFTYFLMVSP